MALYGATLNGIAAKCRTLGITMSDANRALRELGLAMPIDVPGDDNFTTRVCGACGGSGNLSQRYDPQYRTIINTPCPFCRPAMEAGGTHESPLARSEKFLRAHLSAEQKYEFDKLRQFFVRGGDSNTLYRITCTPSFNVCAGGVEYCATLPNTPIYDQMLAQMLMLKFNEKMFLAISNKRAVHTGVVMRSEPMWSSSRIYSFSDDDHLDGTPTGNFLACALTVFVVGGVIVGFFGYALPALFIRLVGLI